MKSVTISQRAIFEEICTSDALECIVDGNGIGTYNEKSMHRILKRYFEPDECYREVRVGKFTADIKHGDSITEIQTASLSGMREKLACFLEQNRVRIVFPIELKRKIVWVNPNNGELTSSKRAAPGETVTSLLEELIYILDYLSHPALTVTAVYIAADEYRMLDGYGKERKKRATSIMRVPTAIYGTDDFSSSKDYARLFPENLNYPFTRDDFAKIIKRRGRRLWACLKFFTETGFVEKVGTEGKRVLYSPTEKYFKASGTKYGKTL